ncbi:MAG: methyltransferase [Clostridia bacterium]|nr:methyltransferase [Clostridia bacterium]
MNNLLKQGERFDDLELDGIGVIQSKSGYAFTSDSVLLANFIKAGHKDNCIELCAGCGVISIIMGHKKKPKSLTLVEIQGSQADRAKRSFAANKMSATVISSRLQGVHKTLGEYCFDVCFANPPYRPKEQASSRNTEVATSTHEFEVNLHELVFEAQKLLKFGGRFFVVFPASRLAELMYELVSQKLEPKEMALVLPTSEKPAELVLVSATKGGKHGMKVLPSIIQNDESGNMTPMMRAIYGKN